MWSSSAMQLDFEKIRNFILALQKIKTINAHMDV
jgi:hypothetical protein